MSDEDGGASQRFAWSESMSVGNAAIDGDHKAFLELVNILHDAKSSDSRELVIESTLLILQEYVLGHFLREEKALGKAGYPRLSAHAKKHAQFRARILEISARYGGGARSAVDGLAELVSDWLRNHILTEDLQFSQWISADIVDARPLVFLSIEAEELNKDGRFDLILP